MPKTDPTKADPRSFIVVKGAKVHNLKNISLALPKNKFLVITGLSGSGKSSLAFDTLYAEGQRRYVESLSSYARQFLGRLDKPEVDQISGISPAIAIEQKVVTRNSRSTVGTSTEIYDYLKLLFARIGHTYSPKSGREVKQHTATDVVNFLNNQPEGIRVIIYSPIDLPKGRKIQDHYKILLQQGYTRLRIGETTHLLSDLVAKPIEKPASMWLVIDRLVVKPGDEETMARIADSAETSFFEGHGYCIVELLGEKKNVIEEFSNKFELDGIQFEMPTTAFFSFNNPVGACKTCEGFGSVIGIDPDAVFPDKSLSVYEDLIACWKGEKMAAWKDKLVFNADKFDFPIHRPYYDLTPEQRELLWTGNKYFKGLNAFFRYLESKSYKIQYRVMLSRYRGRTICPDCKGTRLRKDVAYVKVDGKNLIDLVQLPVSRCLEEFENLNLSKHDQEVADRLLVEIKNRLRFLHEVGLGYLTLNRLSNSLSGGESQRIQLATSLGSSLVGSMYILDEPSIGLHPRDTDRLIAVLKTLQKLGNTVIVVEHDEEMMLAADEIIDMGPLAGRLGGEVVFQGTHEELIHSEKSLTADYLTGKKIIPLPARRRTSKDVITVKGARENNLKNITASFPLHSLTTVTGVSGSGKTTLVRKILYPALKKKLGGYPEKPGEFDQLEGNWQKIKSIEFVDQNPIGKSSRSNPVTYVKAFDEIRALFCKQKLAKVRGYKPGHFSFNVKGGRCETCEGEGVVKISMQFMADIELLCETCKGKRFKNEILEVTYRGKSIADVLDMTVDDAIDFFQEDQKDNLAAKVVGKLQPLQNVGLGYVQLGQASSTLSGGEAQRIKLASFLEKGTPNGANSHTLFIFDEPTTGLHFHDIQKLLDSLNALISKGHSILVIEHNPDVIKCADWIIDLGPEGGDGGGEIIYAGPPEGLADEPRSYTGKFLKSKLEEARQPA